MSLDRRPQATAAAELLDALERREATNAFLLELLRFIQVAPTTTESVRYAADLPMRDFEDALQVAAAVACGANVIATRNVRDYARSPVRATTAASVLKTLAR